MACENGVLSSADDRATSACRPRVLRTFGHRGKLDLVTNGLYLLLGTIATTTPLIVLWWMKRRSRRPRRPIQASAFGWALLFLSSGRMPPPPPQSQIEQEAGERKNREQARADP